MRDLDLRRAVLEAGEAEEGAETDAAITMTVGVIVTKTEAVMKCRHRQRECVEAIGVTMVVTSAAMAAVEADMVAIATTTTTVGTRAAAVAATEDAAAAAAITSAACTGAIAAARVEGVARARSR